MEYVEDSDEDINEWQQIQHPFLDETPSTVHQSSGGWNTPAIEENYLLHGGRSVILPPADPEDGNSLPPPSPASSSSSVCVPDEDVSPMPSPSPSPSEWRLRVANEGWKLLKVRFEAIRDGVVRVASKVRDYAIFVGAFWSIMYVTGVASATAALLVYVGIQRRRRRRTLHQQRMDHMACLLREKDERISQLLLQIAHLNEVLSSRRKVPVLRLSG